MTSHVFIHSCFLNSFSRVICCACAYGLWDPLHCIHMKQVLWLSPTACLDVLEQRHFFVIYLPSLPLFFPFAVFLMYSLLLSFYVLIWPFNQNLLSFRFTFSDIFCLFYSRFTALAITTVLSVTKSPVNLSAISALNCVVW